MVRSFPRALSSLPGLVGYVREFLCAHALPADAAHDLDLVLEELFTNLVKYGRGGRGDIEVGLERNGGHVRLWLREFDADRFDPTAAPAVDVHRPPEERPIGGLGIHLIRHLTEEFRYDWRDRTGTIIATMRTTD